MSGDRGLNFLPPSTRAARRFANVVAGWWIPIKIVFGGSPLAGRNEDPISSSTDICQIISIGGDAWFKQGDDTVVATADADDSFYLPKDQWATITSSQYKYVSMIPASGSSAVLGQIAEMI